MSAQLFRVLVVEDSDADTALLIRHLRSSSYATRHLRVENKSSLKEALLSQVWDVVIVDHSIPGFDSLAAIETVKEARIDIPFIVVSGVMTEQTAVPVLKAGAHDFVTPPRPAIADYS